MIAKAIGALPKSHFTGEDGQKSVAQPHSHDFFSSIKSTFISASVEQSVHFESHYGSGQHGALFFALDTIESTSCRHGSLQSAVPFTSEPPAAQQLPRFKFEMRTVVFLTVNGKPVLNRETPTMIKLTLLLLFCFALAGCNERDSRPAVIETPAPPPVTAETETTAAPEGAVAVVTPTPVTATPPAAPIEQVGRTWTSVDGRTLEAELIGRTTETATIRRNADDKEFTIPIQSLSEADRRYLAASNVPLTQTRQFDTARLQQLKKSCPPLAAKQPLESTFPNLLDVATKYKRSIDALSPTGYARGVAMIRADVAADLKRFVPISSTILKSPPVYSNLYGWSQGSGAWKEVWAARSVVEWLNGPFEAYLVELESLR